MFFKNPKANNALARIIMPYIVKVSSTDDSSRARLVNNFHAFATIKTIIVNALMGLFHSLLGLTGTID